MMQSANSKLRSPRWGFDDTVIHSKGFRPWLLTMAPLGPTSRVTLMSILVFAFLFCGTACQETPQKVKNAVNLYYSGDFPSATNAMRPLAQKKDENFVLNNCRFGSCAFAAGDLVSAEEAFMEAYTVINSVKTNDGGRALGASLVFEGVKVWKGEPFERAMAFYYLGLINLVKGDYDNARSAFNNSLFKLRDYATKDDKSPDAERYTPYESNFALGYFGVGLCYLRMGDPEQAQKNFDRAAQLQPSMAPLAQAAKDPKNNTWIFVDYGQGPRRAGKGWYNEESAFGPTPAEVGPIPPAQVFVDGQSLGLSYQHAVDTLAMAQDQKWQDIDTIRKTKAVIGTGHGGRAPASPPTAPIVTIPAPRWWVWASWRWARDWPPVLKPTCVTGKCCRAPSTSCRSHCPPANTPCKSWPTAARWSLSRPPLSRKAIHSYIFDCVKAGQTH